MAVRVPALVERRRSDRCLWLLAVLVEVRPPEVAAAGRWAALGPQVGPGRKGRVTNLGLPSRAVAALAVLGRLQLLEPEAQDRLIRFTVSVVVAAVAIRLLLRLVAWVAAEMEGLAA